MANNRRINPDRSHLDARRDSFKELSKRPENYPQGPTVTQVKVSPKPHFSEYHMPGSQKADRKRAGKIARRVARKG